MRSFQVVTILFLVLQTLACSGLSSVGPARRGEHEALRAAMNEDVRQGRMSRNAVLRLARIVAEQELEKAEGAAAVHRVQQVRSCAWALERALEKRADGKDDAAPLAAWALLSIERGSPRAWRSHLDSQDSAWRAVAVRTLTRVDHGETRRSAMLDHDGMVRLAAVQASEATMDKMDREVLLDVARNDPDEKVRVMAIRALGWVATQEDVLVMRDLWAFAPRPVRQSLVSAWSFPGTLDVGGRRQLLWVAETQTGSPAIVAGGILLRLGGETRGVGLSALRKAMQDGVARDRNFAMAMVPLQEEGFLEFIEKLAEDAEPEVRVAALAKLAAHPTKGASAREKLGHMAISEEPGRAEARSAMARIGDARVTRLLLEDAKSSDRRVRESSMRSFVMLGDGIRAAFFLADPDVGLRVGTACHLLSTSSRW